MVDMPGYQRYWNGGEWIGEPIPVSPNTPSKENSILPSIFQIILILILTSNLFIFAPQIMGSAPPNENPWFYSGILFIPVIPYIFFSFRLLARGVPDFLFKLSVWAFLIYAVFLGAWFIEAISSPDNTYSPCSSDASPEDGLYREDGICKIKFTDYN